MPDVRVTIDGKEVSVPANSTVLEAAQAAGVEIPVLCHHPVLKPIGACRMCLVEVEKQRTLQPACTFPVNEGMVVHTTSSSVMDSRRFVLQLLFSERNHFCMFCQSSESCELQSLAYDHGLDHWEFDRAFPEMPVDASRKYFAMDHNRCILCRRCIRACDELVGNHTLGLKNRGADTMVIADMDVPFGESTCVSCGTCLQSCPTGALMDRASAYLGADEEVTRIKSRCMACSVGCGVELVVRDGRVIRIEGDWDAEPNRGLLCEIGRFMPLHEMRQRARKPLVRNGSGLEEASWEQALEQVAGRIKGAGDDAYSVVSGYASTEAAAALAGLPGRKALLGSLPAEGSCTSLTCLDEADVFIVVSADLTVDYQVAGFAVKRGVDARGARLIILDDAENGLESWAKAQWSTQDADRAVEIAREAEMPVVIYDARGAAVAEALAARLPNARRVAFPQGGNARGIAAAGISAVHNGHEAKVYYVLAGEMAQVDPALMETLKKADFVAVQTSYREPWEEVADVILPSPTNYEKSGTMTAAEGVAYELVVAASTRLPSEVEVIEQIGALVR
jgi:formate dehydrogenase major subunit